MASSIRLANAGAPDTPPLGYARIYVEDVDGVIYLKMKRPDGSVQVFGTVDEILNPNRGGTGLTAVPAVGEFLIGTGTGYRLGEIVAGSGINIVKTDTTFEISTTSGEVGSISNVDIVMPPEFNVEKTTEDNKHAFNVNKVEQVKNSIYAAPVDADGQPVFRFLQVEDIPDLPIEKITNLIETIRAESLLVPTDSDDIDHTYDTTTKVLTSSIKPTGVTSGSYGTATAIASFTVKADGRIDQAADVDIAIPSTQVTDFVEATQDVVGQLTTNSDSVNAEYNDFDNTLKFHVNEEHLITTNISDTENTRAPTSQSIKAYVDNLVEAERTSRVDDDNEIRTKIDTFLENATIELDTIVEISQRFDSVEDAIKNGATTQAQALSTEVQAITTRLNETDQAIADESQARQDDISSVNADITAETDARIENDAVTLAAAKQYTDDEITKLIDSAPGVLDTLKELSDALGGDENFATTITTRLSNVETNLSSEVTRATNKENTLTTQLNTLDTLLGNETQNRVTAQTNLQTAIDDLGADLTVESNTRIDQDNLIKARLDIIEGSGTGSVAKAQSDAQAHADAAVLVEKNRAETAESTLQGNIDTVEANLAQELLDRATADTALQTNLNTEVDRATAKENEIAGNLTAEINTRTSEVATLTTNLATEVSNRTTAINDEVTARSDADTALQNNINTEKARAEAAELALDTKITDEVTRATGAETLLQTNIDNEKARAEEVETQLDADIAAEETRAIAAEGVLQANIDTENTRAIAAENKLTTDLAKEVTDRTEAIAQEVSDRNAAIQTAVTQSIIPRVNEEYDLGSPEFKFRSLYVSGNTIYIGDTALSSSSGAISLPEGSTINDLLIASENYVDDSVSAEATLRETRDTEITNLLDDEVSRATNAETALETAINDESAARIAADTTLTTNLNKEIEDRIDAVSAEKVRAETAEAAIQSNLDIETQSRISEDTQLQTNINNEAATREAADLAEKTRAEAAESLLTTNLETEVARAQQKENELSAALTLETSNRISGDNALQGLISSETTRASNAEQALQNSLNNEITARQTADSGLQSQINTEKGRIDAILLASQADKDSFAEIVTLINSVDTENDQAFASYVLSNDQALSNEISARTSADSTLQSNIDAEKNRAIAAESGLSSAISTEASNRQTSISAETTAREAADANLQENINSEKTARETADVLLQTTITQLQQSLGNETEALQSSISQTQSNIDAERIRATGVENDLQQQIINETTLRLDGDAQTLQSANAYTDAKVADLIDSAPEMLNTLKELSDALGGDKDFATTISNQVSAAQASVDAEEAARIAADAALQAEIDSEESRALAAEANLQAAVDALETSIATEVQTRGNADSALSASLASEVERAQNAENELRAAIDQLEITAGQDLSEQVAALQNDLTAEETARINAIAALNLSISSQEVSFNSQIAQLNSTLSTSIATAKSDSLAYTDARVSELVNSAPEVLNTLSELASALNNDKDFATTVTNQVSTVQNNLNIEKNRALSAEALLSSQIASETASRQSEITSLSTQFSQNLENEVNLLESATNLVKNDLIQEIANRTSGDSQTLTSANQYTDTKITELLGSTPELLNTIQEISNALGNDANFAVNVNNQITTIQSLLNNEISRSQTADTDFQTQLDQIRMLYGKDLQPYKQEFVITEADLLNGYVELSTRSVVLNSVIAWVDRLGIFEGVDYQLQDNAEENWLRLTFSGELIGESQQSLQIGDIIHVNYLIADGDELQEAVNQINSNIATETQNRIDSDTQLQANLDSAVEALSERIERGTFLPVIESFTISAQNVANNYIELSNDNLVENSITATLNRVNLLENIDFSIQKTLNGKNRLVFSNMIPVEVGEYIRLNYLTANTNDLFVYPNYDNYTLTETDISNNSLMLSKTNVMRESIQVYVDRIPLLQGVDFVISTNTENKSILSFIGDVLPNGPLALESGENIRVNYLYRP